MSAWEALALASGLPLRHSRDVQRRVQGSGGGAIAAARDEAGVASKREKFVGKVRLLLAVKPLITAMPLSRATEPRGWEARERRGERAAIEAASRESPGCRGCRCAGRHEGKPPARQATEREE